MSQVDYDKYLHEMRKLIRRAYRQKGSRRPNQRSPGEELRLTVKRYRKSMMEVPPDVGLWLALLDEVAAFWLCAWATYRDWIIGPDDKHFLCLTALAGRGLQDILCVRELIVGGFFVQSNAVTRSLIEVIDVMHLVNSRTELASEFVGAEDNDSSSKFWHQYCSKKKIHKIVKERWLWFSQGDEDFASSLHGMRENYMDLMGMSSHPTFSASFSSFMDSAGNVDSNIAENVMGSPSHMSKFTIHMILLRVFEYGILWIGPQMSLYREEGSLRPKPIFYDNLSKGLSVLLSSIMAVNEKRSDNDPFFPEFKTYWARSNFGE